MHTSHSSGVTKTTDQTIGCGVSSNFIESSWHHICYYTEDCICIKAFKMNLLSRIQVSMFVSVSIILREEFYFYDRKENQCDALSGRYSVAIKWLIHRDFLSISVINRHFKKRIVYSPLNHSICSHWSRFIKWIKRTAHT